MGQHILVAEDDRVLAEIVRFNLCRAEFDVLVAHNGQTALEHSAAQKFDLIISDYQMPRLCGKDLCKGIRQGTLNSDTPIIFCSAKGYEIDTDAIQQELQVSRIFVKPFSPRELVETVRELLAVKASTE